MNEHDEPAEKLLQQLEPAELPVELMARLTAARAQLAVPERPRAHWLLRLLLPAAAVAGAAALTVFFLHHSGPPEPPLAKAALPVIFEDRIVATRELGTFLTGDSQPWQLLEVEWVETGTLAAPTPGEPLLHVETTRREFVPVRLEIF